LTVTFKVTVAEYEPAEMISRVATEGGGLGERQRFSTECLEDVLQLDGREIANSGWRY